MYVGKQDYITERKIRNCPRSYSLNILSLYRVNQSNISVSLETSSISCNISTYPNGITNPAIITYMEDRATIVACGGYSLDDSTKCFEFDGLAWSPIAPTTKRHCTSYSTSAVVDDVGLWVAGVIQVGDNMCTARWTSEVYDGSKWRQVNGRYFFLIQ